MALVISNGKRITNDSHKRLYGLSLLNKMTISNSQFDQMKARTDAAIKRGSFGSVALKPHTANAEPKLVCGRSINCLVIEGQIRGGKNNMIVTRTGLHFPKPAWAKWRDEAVNQVKPQLPVGFKPFSEPINVRLTYVSGDNRRRDMPAILDSIFHVLEKAGVVTDDTLIWVSESSRAYDKSKPRAIVEFLKHFLGGKYEG